MKITPQEVRYVADLARLELDPCNVETLARQLATILAYMDKLNEVDTHGIAPTSHALALTNAFREDQGHTHLSTAAALDNAPQHTGGNFLVPKVI